MKETPGLPGLGVVGFAQVVQQVFGYLRFDQLGAADVQYGRRAIGLFVDLVDDAVTSGHCLTSGWRRPP